MSRLSGFAAVLVLALSAQAFGGHVWTRRAIQQSLAGHPEQTEVITYADKNKIRTERKTGLGADLKPTQIMILRGDKNLMWILDPEKKEYEERTQADMLAQNVARAAEEKKADVRVQTAYAQATPAQREDMLKPLKDLNDTYAREAIRKIKGHPTPPEAYLFKPTHQTWNVQAWTCQVFALFRNGEKLKDVCVIDGDQVAPGLANAAKLGTRVFQELAVGTEGRVAENTLALDKAKNKALGSNGFILKEVRFRFGKAAETEELIEAHQDQVKPALFEVPSGFRKVPWGRTPHAR